MSNENGGMKFVDRNTDEVAWNKDGILFRPPVNSGRFAETPSENQLLFLEQERQANGAKMNKAACPINSENPES